MVSEAHAAWNDALMTLATHEAFCTVCSAAAGRRCAEGQQLDDADQLAWQAWVVERYGAAA